jgi:hypothetical protein
LDGKKQGAEKVLPPAVRGGHAGQVIEPQRDVGQGKTHIQHRKKHHHNTDKRPPRHGNEPLVGVVLVRAAASPHVERAVVVDSALGAAREFFANAGVERGHEKKRSKENGGRAEP